MGGGGGFLAGSCIPSSRARKLRRDRFSKFPREGVNHVDAPPPPSPHLTIQTVEKFTVVEFRTPSLMDPVQLEEIGKSIYRLVDEEDRRWIVLDFEKVTYLSSQAIGIVLNVNKKLSALKNSKLILCGVGARLMELIKITRLDRILTIKPSQREAVKVF
jgi:anti-sigma B factor antagonist